MSIRIDGTNTTANPGITGSDTDTGLQFGTNEVKIVTDGSDRVTVDSSGNFGIGESIPAAGLDVKVDTNPVLAIDRGSANTANFNLQYNGTLTGQLSAANADFQLSGVGSSTPISFYANGSERMRILSSGGITFNGDTAQANALDDYEEGGWTPTANQSISLTVYESNYVKIGASVTYTTYFSVGTNSSSAELIISGFPFNADGVNNYHCCAVNSDANLGHQLIGQYNRGSGSGLMQLVKNDSNTKATGANMSGKFVIFTLTVTLH